MGQHHVLSFFVGKLRSWVGSGPRHDLVSLVSLTRVGLGAPAQPRLTKGGQPYQGLAVSDSPQGESR